LLLYLFIAAHSLVVVLFFVSSRYRLPIVPILLLFAGSYVTWVVARLQRQERRVFWLSILLVAAAFAAVNSGYAALDLIYRGEEERYLGVYHQSRGDLGGAERAYRRAIKMEPDYAEAHAELAQVLQQQSRHREALPHFLRANELAPNSEKTQYLLGTAFLAVGDTSRAEERFRTAIQMAPLFALPHRELGILLLERGELAQAEQLLLKAGRNDPDDIDTWYKMGQCYFLQGRYREAELALLEAARLAPGDLEIRDKIKSLRILPSPSR
jgi:tetratricopeptide (TPR) repeat protein